MRVPSYSEQVDTRQPDVPQPQFTKPPVDAFGVNVAEANQKVGQALSNVGESLGKMSTVLAKHMQERAKAKNDQIAYDAAERYTSDIQNLLYDDSTTSIKASDGKDYEIPKGLLARTGTSAEKITDEYDDKEKAIFNKYLNQIQPESREKFNDTLRWRRFSHREKVISYQGEQGRKANEKTSINQMNSIINLDIPDAKSKEELDFLFKGIDHVNDELKNYKGESDEEAQKRLQNITVNGIKKIAFDRIGSGNFDGAKEIIEYAKDRLGDQYKSVLIEVNGLEKQVKEDARLDTALSLSQKLSNGSLQEEDIQNALLSGDMEAETSSAFKVALFDSERWKQFKKKEKEAGSDAVTFLNLINEKTSTPSDNYNVLKSAITNYNEKKLNWSNLVFLIRAVGEKRQKPDSSIWPQLKSAIDMMAKTVPEGAVVSVLGRFQNLWNFNADPRPLMKQAIKDQVHEDNPELSLKDDVSNAKVTAEDGFKNLYSGTSALKPDFTIKKQPKTPSYSEEDLNFTAQKHGITVEQLKKRLGIR